MTFPQKHLALPTIPNCRDLGGCPCADGSTTQFGRILRAAIPYPPDPQDISSLFSYGVRAVVDLRGDYEAAAYPSVFCAHPNFRYRHVSLYEINPAVIAEGKTLWSVYERSVREYSQNYAAALRALLELNAPTVVHCFLGKDRTGILCALLLALAGVSPEDIVADYQVSAVYLRPFYAKEATAENGLMWETHQEHLGSPAENVTRLLQFWTDNFGGAAGYAKSIGLSADEIERVSQLLK